MTPKTDEFAPPLPDSFYAESYELRKAASTITATAIDWFQKNATNLLEVNYSLCDQDKDTTFSVLSVGSGEGDVDVEIIKILAQELGPRWNKLEYVALEPNATHRKLFQERLNDECFGSHIQVSVHSEGFNPTKNINKARKYHLVLFVQVMYYFGKPYQAIQSALAQTKMGGNVVVVHQTATGVAEIQQDHMLEIKGNQDEMFFSEDLRSLLDAHGHPHRYHHIDAHLDITECLRETPCGIDIMSFCMECDLRSLRRDKYQKVLDAFSKRAQRTRDTEEEAFVLHEPFAVVVLPAPNVTIDKRHANDQDPVLDYWQLATRFDWSGTFSSQAAQQGPMLSNEHKDQEQQRALRLLDIACGTGRWIEAIHHYLRLDPKTTGTIVYDLLDPCKSSLSQASSKIQSAPFLLGQQFAHTVQEAPVEHNTYDLIWSMHGFYMIPCQDLMTVLHKFSRLLKHDTGIAFIGMATRKSFHVDFYNAYRSIFHSGVNTGFTAAEDLIETLCAAGTPHKVHKIFFEERIAQDDTEALEHYIKNESTVNCFNKDKGTEELSESTSISLDDLLSHPDMKAYLSTFIRGSAYYFPQEVLLISFVGRET